MKRLPPVSIGFLPKGLTCHRGATNWCAIVGRGPRDMRKLQSKWHQKGEKPPAWSTRTTAEAEETSLERDTLWEPDHELAVFRALSPLSSTRAPWDGWVYSPRQAGLSKVTRLVSSSRARTRTQVCWLTAPCCSPSNLLSPTCCQPRNQSYCCSGCRNNNSSINPSHVPGALQSKGAFYHHPFAWISLISVGERQWGTAVTNMGFGSVSLPLGAPLRWEVRRGKEPREAGNPPQQAAQSHSFWISLTWFSCLNTTRVHGQRYFE